MSLPVLSRPTRPLDAALALEWADPRQPEYTPHKSPARWRCPQGHTYEAARWARERGAGCPTCPSTVTVSVAPDGAGAAAGTAAQVAAAVNAPPAKNAPKRPRKAPVSGAATPPPPAPSAAPGGPAGGPGGVSATCAASGAPQVVTGAGQGGAPDGSVTITGGAASQWATRPGVTRGLLTVYGPDALPVRAYEWEECSVERDAPSGRPAHHVLVLDRSGSMYGDVAALRDGLRKVLTLEEHARPGLLVTVVSYSSAGDAQVHLARVPIGEVCQPGSPHLAHLDRIRADGLTCVSGGLSLALRYVELPGLATSPASEREDTVVTLHSDGYANDPSPASERRACSDLVRRLRAAGATLSSVAYRQSSDFAFLQELAREGGGGCALAQDAAQVHGLLAAAQRVCLKQPRAARVRYGTSQSTSRWSGLLLSRSAGRAVLSGPEADELVAAGLGPQDDALGWRLRGVSVPGSRAAWQPPADAQPSDAELRLCLALARAELAAGRVAAACDLARTSRLLALQPHLRALTSPQQAALASALDELLLRTGTSNFPALPRVELRPPSGPCALDVLAAVARHPGGLLVHVPTLAASYQRRGLKRLPGTRDAQGAYTPHPYATRPRRTDGWAAVVSADLNDQEATANLTLSQPVDLVDLRWLEGKSVAGEPGADRLAPRVAEVAGVPLDELRDYRAYTVVADGELHVQRLEVRVVDRALHGELVRIGALGPKVAPTDTSFGSVVKHQFAPDARRTLDLSALSLLPPKCEPPTGEQVTLALRLTVLQRLLRASLRNAIPVKYSPEQVAELRAAGVACGGSELHFSPPSTSAHADLKAALRSGDADARTRYRVTFGTPRVLHPGELYSGNEFLQRRFEVREVQDDGSVHPDPVAKPTCADALHPGSTVRWRTLTARTKLGPVDDLSVGLYESVLYTGTLGDSRRDLARLLREATLLCAPTTGGAPLWVTDERVRALWGDGAPPVGPGDGLSLSRVWDWTDEAVRRAALRLVDDALESLRDRQRAAVFLVGATGQVPAEWCDGPAMDAAALAKRFPALSPGKREAEGSFYALRGGAVCSVWAESAPYTVRW